MATALIAALTLLIIAVVAQVVVPRIGERQIERRLAENGGDAFVVIEALPALRLLRRSGDRLMVRGRGLEIGMSGDGQSGGLSALDGFGEVDIVLREFVTGPFAVNDFALTRSGGSGYLMRSRATTSGTALAAFGGELLGGLASPVLGVVAGATPAAVGARAIAIAVEVELASEEGRLVVASGAGRIAGYPAGPIASMIAAAVARRLELAP